ncbi:unnamed protein product [Notodromas monacha]|uniref:STAS domain-containing protein n=1 Tax=Notodromas monacha TaxID=399045 RepID=A0A7R9BYM1_9CRUS|nr:unnamed protein product [Notodromas monacha]CAG0923781.1 unnamed protein product [Notodromas monacha]
MRKTFANVTFDGVKEKGVAAPRRKLKRLDSEYEPSFGSKEYFRRKMGSCCTQKTLRRKVPVISWLPKYTSVDFIGDLIAGITVGFTIIPQGIAFAELANLPAQYGLYAGYLGSLIYILLGTTKEITIGPAAVICILLGGATYDNSTTFNLTFVTILCMISGCFSLLMGLLKLAPVTAGFITAAALVIIVSQFKSLLGLKGVHGEQLLELVPGVYSKLPTTNYHDMYMSLIACAVLIFMQEMKRFNWNWCIKNPERASKFQQVTFVVSSARNALVLVACAIGGYYYNEHMGQKVISLTKAVPNGGIPPPKVPDFWLPAMNETIHGEIKFAPERGLLDILKQGGSAVFIIPIICLVEQVAVCKSFSKAKPVDVNQEMISLGISQLVASFFHSMPVTGSICRSCVNAVSGVRTPFGGLWSACVVLSALLFFTPYMEHIPKPALGAIVVCAVIHMIEYEEIWHIIKTKKRDLVPLFITLGSCCTIGLEWGFLIGVVVNLLMLLIFAADPKVPIMKFKIHEDRRVVILKPDRSLHYPGVEKIHEDRRVVILKPDRSLHYPGVEKVRNLISKKAQKHMDAMIIVDCVNLIDIDFTGAKGLGSVAAALRERNQKMIFVNVCSNIDRALKGFTHGEVETYETAQDWIDTLADVNDKRIMVRSLSSLNDCDTHHNKHRYPEKMDDVEEHQEEIMDRSNGYYNNTGTNGLERYLPSGPMPVQITVPRVTVAKNHCGNCGAKVVDANGSGASPKAAHINKTSYKIRM